MFTTLPLNKLSQIPRLELWRPLIQGVHFLALFCTPFLLLHVRNIVYL